MTLTAPTAHRFVSLDFIRGIAILGILIMNIQNFSMIGQAYINPTVYGDLTGINKWVWVVSHVMADQKFMSIFSMLFGASILLILERVQQKGGSVWRIHYTRNFWLLVIGTIHSYFMWYGDILFPYAVCSFLVFIFRKLSIKKLVVTGFLFFSIASLLYLFFGLSLPFLPEEAVADIQKSWSPSQRLIDNEVNAYLGSFSEQSAQRIKSANMMHTDVFLFFFFWRIMGLMLIGMGLYKSGFLTGQWSIASYRKMLFSTLPIGLALVVIGVVKYFDSDWSMDYGMFLGSQFNYWGSLLMALGYIALANLWVVSGWHKGVIDLFSAVGRQALSNYLFQTIICTFIFYGFGLGYFGQIDRIGQILIVFGVWIFQVLCSIWWQRRFHYGPFEWLWRSATFGKWQPFRKY